MRPTRLAHQNPLLLVAVGLGVVVLLALLLSLITRRPGEPPRPTRPVAAPPPAVHGPFTPVYGGGVPPGRRRGGF